MTWQSEPPTLHRCPLPYEPDISEVREYWVCPDARCGKAYTVAVSAWTSWWSYCADTGDRVENGLGITIMCHEEEYVHCPPNITYTPYGWKGEYNSYGMGHVKGIPIPEHIAATPAGTRRPITRNRKLR